MCAGSRPARAYRYFVHAGRGDERDRARSRPRLRASAAAVGSVRDHGRRRRDAGHERQAGVQPLRGLRSAWLPSGTTSTSTSATRSTRTARSAARRSRAPSRRSGGSTSSGSRLPALRKLRASAGLYSHWDDHEFINDFSRPEHGEAIYAAGVKAFRDYSPVDVLRRNWASTGRSAGGSTSSSSSSTSARSEARRRRRRAAATSRRRRRRRCATRSRRSRPDSGIPSPPACLAAIDDPSRTMLGARQYAAFTKAIKASKATWKVVVNEVPIQQYYALPYDRWEGYAAERERLLRFLQANVKNVVFLTTDTHANLVNEVRYEDARRRARELRDLGGRHRARRDEHVREGDRQLPRPAGRRHGDRRALLQAARRRTGWACAAPRSTRTATRR